jgi:hypothetical protein
MPRTREQLIDAVTVITAVAVKSRDDLNYEANNALAHGLHKVLNLLAQDPNYVITEEEAEESLHIAQERTTPELDEIKEAGRTVSIVVDTINANGNPNLALQLYLTLPMLFGGLYMMKYDLENDEDIQYMLNMGDYKE